MVVTFNKSFVLEDESKDVSLLYSNKFDSLSKYFKASKIEGRKPIATIQDKDYLLDPEFEGV